MMATEPLDRREIPQPPARLADETLDLVGRMNEKVENVAALDRLIVALKAAGIWGPLGEIDWTRDLNGSLLLCWRPVD